MEISYVWTLYKRLPKGHRNVIQVSHKTRATARPFAWSRVVACLLCGQCLIPIATAKSRVMYVTWDVLCWELDVCNPSESGETYMSKKIMPSLTQMMASRLFGTEPSFGSLLIFVD